MFFNCPRPNSDRTHYQIKAVKTDYQNLRILAVDEISIKKGQKYLVVVLDYLSGRVVWVGKERTKETLGSFFAGMTQEHRDSLEAVAMDMWNPYIHATKKHVPHVKDASKNNFPIFRLYLG